MNIKKLSWLEFEKNFNASVRKLLRAKRLEPGVMGMALLRCHVMDSSRCGLLSALPYGSNNTFKSLKDMEIPQGVYISGMPSSAAFLEAYTEDIPDASNISDEPEPVLEKKIYSKGIDYGNGKTNIDKETGIRYGVISANEVTQAWYDSSEPHMSPFLCLNCGTEIEDMEEYKCPKCGKKNEDMENEPESYVLDDGEYKAEASCPDGDIFIFKSPYYTLSEFCSPCAPGAGYIMHPVEDGVKTYCFGHEWFDEGAPYPIYSVATNELVEG